MPTYEYQCKQCGRFEVFQKITASPLTECPTCQGKVQRVMSAPAVVFNASGFYTTDNRSSDYKKSSETPSSSSSSSNDKAS